MKSLSPSPEQVLILAPTLNDATLARDVLERSGLQGAICEDIEDLCVQLQQGCGTVVISEEALTYQGIELLQDALTNQEAWSDQPIILLTNVDMVHATEIFSKSGNISLLERPFSQLTLVRSVEVALRARKRQYQVRDLLSALRRSKEEAELANRTKTQFLANMSHEIRTPIGAIMGFMDLIKNAPADTAQNIEYMDIIDRNSQQLLHLIDDILDLSKVEAGKMSVEQFSFRLPDFLADLSSNIKFRAAEKGLFFRIHFTTDVPEFIISDPVRLRQILSNVLGNAIKFTDRGFIELHVGFNHPFLAFKVKDSGIGLSPNQIGKLFQPFVQADTSTTRKYGGTGLGLVLSRRLAEALGGNLILEESILNHGSVFSIEIHPTLPPQVNMVKGDGLTATRKVKEVRRSEVHFDGAKILLVEDSTDNQILIATYLASTGVQIDIKSNGSEGVDAALIYDYDAILMDLQMPQMDGHEATQILRQKGFTKPIIALTAHAMNEEKARCLASGFTDYLTKPIEKNILVETLNFYLLQPQRPAFSEALLTH